MWFFRTTQKPQKSITPKTKGVTKMHPDLSQAEINSIEMIRKWELEDYVVVHPALHHYRFTLSTGEELVYGIIGLVSLRDELKEKNLYVSASKKEPLADVIQLSFQSSLNC